MTFWPWLVKHLRGSGPSLKQNLQILLISSQTYLIRRTRRPLFRSIRLALAFLILDLAWKPCQPIRPICSDPRFPSLAPILWLVEDCPSTVWGHCKQEVRSKRAWRGISRHQSYLTDGLFPLQTVYSHFPPNTYQPPYPISSGGRYPNLASVRSVFTTYP